jgi:uncharacterized protein
MIQFLKKLIGRDDRFFVLLENSAQEAHGSVELLSKLLKGPDGVGALDQFALTRRKEKRITEEISEQLCRSFVTPLEREDIESLATALYKIPKTVEKFSERYVLSNQHVQDVNFIRQLEILEQATATLIEMVRRLRQRSHLEAVKDQNERLHYLEREADKFMMAMIKDLYSGRHDALRVVVLLDLYETLERIIDRCRDAGNAVFQIVLKYS